MDNEGLKIRWNDPYTAIAISFLAQSEIANAHDLNIEWKCVQNIIRRKWNLGVCNSILNRLAKPTMQTRTRIVDCSERGFTLTWVGYVESHKYNLI